MSGFKLIALRPMPNCEPRLLKNLKTNLIFKFCQNYDFLDSEGRSVDFEQGNTVQHISVNSAIPEGLYDIRDKSGKTRYSVNITAIVGMNGSGKSSILELLFAIAYNLAVGASILKKVEDDNGVEQGLSSLNIHAELYFQIGDVIWCLVCRGGSQEFVQFVKNGIGEYFDRTDSEQKSLKEYLKNHFFYSIAVNYSLYGLNSTHMGLWVKSLFHKNDGYQTPLVINPFRDDGNIDVNIENDLAKQRLLTNILNPSWINRDNVTLNEEASEVHGAYSHLTGRKVVSQIHLTLNRKKIKYLYKRSDDTEFLYDDLYSIHPRQGILDAIFSKLLEGREPLSDVKFRKEVEDYIVKKVVKIARTYKEYPFYRDEPTSADSPPSYFIDLENTLLDRLKKDRSHLTLKLRQALNYLVTAPLEESELLGLLWQKVEPSVDQEIQEDADGQPENTQEAPIWKLAIPVDLLSGQLRKLVRDEEFLIEYLPPGIFDIDISIEEDGRQSLFSNMSSGEQQFIHTIQTIVYHINNVESVFENKNEYDPRITYRNINLILDEIELYFHPEFQRRFLSELRKAIGRLNLSHARNFNIIFSTHSPFILSDVVDKNLLNMAVGEPRGFEEGKTFAANIHDLLRNDFFLKESFMGEFARDTINQVIYSLSKKMEPLYPLRYELFETVIDGIPAIDVPVLKKGECERIISLVAEPVLKQSLMRLYSVAYPENAADFIDQQIEALQQLKKNDRNTN
jgi:hypothetical protein